MHKLHYFFIVAFSIENLAKTCERFSFTKGLLFVVIKFINHKKKIYNLLHLIANFSQLFLKFTSCRLKTLNFIK